MIPPSIRNNLASLRRRLHIPGRHREAPPEHGQQLASLAAGGQRIVTPDWVSQRLMSSRIATGVVALGRMAIVPGSRGSRA